MNVLLVPLGSHGDVHPFVGIGQGLRARGHRVRVIVNPFFGDLVESAGLELVPLGTADDYRRRVSDPMLWRRIGGTRSVLRSIGDLVAPVYHAIAEHQVPEETVVVASTLALGARVAQEKLDIPTATVHLQPSIFFSTHEPPKLPGLFIPPWMPRWIGRAQYALVDCLLDPLIAPPLNQFRAELGLAPVKRIVGSYMHSPQRVIGMFPEWYAPPQPDWPAQTRLTSFPLYDERGVTRLPDNLLRFLDESDPPIAFTPGSAMWRGERFFAESAKACEILGRRGLLLTRHREHLPRTLPPSVLHVEYAPFSELLPRCAALVHHGGIGTSSQALAAGVPQLVMPHAHDQPDNAARLVKLGVARSIEPKRYRGERVARVLAELCQDATVVSQCVRVRSRFDGVDPISDTCELIEQLAGRTECRARVSSVAAG